ncbi:glycoprotein glucosyltransferase 1 [Hordeum vulgare]|nr:glycoprotein glucosyltransferase 1 [Hordeum vulgare]
MRQFGLYQDIPPPVSRCIDEETHKSSVDWNAENIQWINQWNNEALQNIVPQQRTYDAATTEAYYNWCSVIFDGTNYAEFVGFMYIHMRGLLPWGVLCGELPCPPCPVAPVAPTPSVPPVMATDASEVDQDATKALNDVAVDAYDQ